MMASSDIQTMSDYEDEVVGFSPFILEIHLRRSPWFPAVSSDDTQIAS